uniref:Uncharacterized protein n=1 Tax=Vitis vinifera TaxID=29760 RepID=F6HY68_VITVI
MGLIYEYMAGGNLQNYVSEQIEALTFELG